MLSFFGVSKLAWLTNGNLAEWAIVIITVWKNLGYCVLILTVGLAGISRTYYEAAEIDGSSASKTFLHITLPLLKPMVILMLLMSIGKIFNSDFGLFYQVTLNQGLLTSTTQTIDTYVYRALMELNNIGMSSAASVFQAVLGFLLVVLSNAFVRVVDNDNALF